MIVLLAALVLPPSAARAQDAACAPEMARVTSIQGEVEFRTSEDGGWKAADLDDVLCLGSVIRVGVLSRAALVFTDDSTLRLDQSTTLIIREREQERRTWLEMLTGAIHFFSHRPRSLGVETPFVNAAAEGTEFLIRVGGAEAHILMFEGVVLASNEAGELRLGPDDAALIREGEKPIPEIVVRPRDAVAWAVHYPPVLSVLEDRGAPGAYAAPVKNALEWLDEGNYRYALRSLDQAPADARDAQNETLRAGIFLNIGRVEEAEAAIERALATDADFADAYAQRSIIHVVRNERAQALRDADRAVQLAPASSTALIAQSYARQASFDLEGARQSLREAVKKDPNDALAFARLAEVELSFADYDRANDAADQAVSLAPDLARTQTVRGFSYLAAIDTGAARTSFTRAIELNSADPLPHLGQGLAKIRDGDLEAGRRDLEIAASLDPNNALIRSYLGKAYFEEKRGPRDATQFEIAKKLDPKDPTPWFYDAIRKQTENRPVEALQDLEKAIELNDNRAVYRSRLLLDGDLASRATSLARIYNELDLAQVAVNAASRSLSYDPMSYSAHRFLAEAYGRRSRQEIARVSELLQAQLLQPININPILPSLAIANFNAGFSAASNSATSGELGSLFERDDRTRLLGSGMVGNNGTWGDEFVVSSHSNDTSISAGQFYSTTEGFRTNNELENSLYDLLIQKTVNTRLNVQGEYRHRRTKQGDLAINFDPESFDQAQNRDVKDNLFRLGAKYQFNISSLVLASIGYADEKEIGYFIFPSQTRNNVKEKQKGNQIDIQYIFNAPSGNLISGFNIFESDVSIEDEFIDNQGNSSQESFDFDIKNRGIYLYNNMRLSDAITSTFGIQAIDFDDFVLSTKRINPKLGIDWRPTDWLNLRGAVFSVVKPPFLFDQTLEPTQIAGFNQFFDDQRGSRSTLYGLGLDIKPSEKWLAGASLSVRNIDFPINLGDDVFVEKRREYLTEIYASGNFSRNASFNIGISFERFERRKPFEFDVDPPLKLDTLSLPFGLKYFDESGIYLGFKTTYLYQELDRSDLSSFASGKENSVLIDMLMGYRFKKNAIGLQLEFNNILDRDFFVQDDSFRSSDINRVSKFIPDRSIVLRGAVSF